VAQPSISTVERGRLIESLDTLADVAHAIEVAADTGRRLDDPDDLIARLRGVIADLAFDLEASDFLSPSGDPRRAAPAPPGQQILNLRTALRQLDNDHHQARERLFAELARRGASAPAACLHCAAGLDLDDDGQWQHPDTDCAYRDAPYLADRRADVRITLRLDPDDHPLVWVEGGDAEVYFGDPGAGAAGVRTKVIIPGPSARRWFTDLIVQLHDALDRLDEPRA
jgi:hypothetical protein